MIVQTIRLGFIFISPLYDVYEIHLLRDNKLNGLQTRCLGY